jgi:methylthioribulose-1-phosphate dehydratase
MSHNDPAFEDIALNLVQVGQQAFHNGWVPATSGNFSSRLDAQRIAITVSGAHKGRLGTAQIMLVDYQGRPLDHRAPSAETILHTQLYTRYSHVNAVLHTHSVTSTVLSRLVDGALELQGFEVAKALTGIDTHETIVKIPVFKNDQDMQRLSNNIAAYLESEHPIPGYLIEGHGLYTWGESIADSLRHLEAFEFMFACELEMRRCKP